MTTTGVAASVASARIFSTRVIPESTGMKTSVTRTSIDGGRSRRSKAAAPSLATSIPRAGNSSPSERRRSAAAYIEATSALSSTSSTRNDGSAPRGAPVVRPIGRHPHGDAARRAEARGANADDLDLQLDRLEELRERDDEGHPLAE